MIKFLKMVLGVNIIVTLLLGAYLGYSYLYPETAKEAEVQQASPVSKKLGTWELVCQKVVSSSGESCAATRKIIDPNSQQLIFIWTIGYNKEGNFINVFRGGNRLKPGQPVLVAFKDKTSFNADNTVCNESYCEYLLPMTSEFVKKFDDNASISFQVIPNQGDDITITIKANEVDEVIKSVKRDL